MILLPAYQTDYPGSHTSRGFPNHSTAGKSQGAEDIENCLRHNNVRIVGLPEKVEGRDPTEFVEQWLQEVFSKESFTPVYAVERAPRVPPQPLPPHVTPPAKLQG